MKSERLVTKHVYAVTSGDMHVFLIVQPDGITLIDAGFPGTWPLIEEALEELGRKPEDVHDILVTHCHPDHAGGLAEIKRATGAKVWMHAADADMVAQGKAFRPWKPAPGLRNWWFGHHVVRKSPQAFEPVAVEQRGALRARPSRSREASRPSTPPGTAPATWCSCGPATAGCSSPATRPTTCRA